MFSLCMGDLLNYWGPRCLFCSAQQNLMVVQPIIASIEKLLLDLSFLWMKSNSGQLVEHLTKCMYTCLHYSTVNLNSSFSHTLLSSILTWRS